MKEKRKHQRACLEYYPKIYDRKSNELIGYAVDLSADGLRITSMYPLQCRQHYQFTIKNAEGKKVRVEAVCCWSQLGEAYYSSGCSVIKASDALESVFDKYFQQSA